MCGIFLVVGDCKEENLNENVCRIINNKLLRRGPDCYLQISDCKCEKTLNITGSVLHLRGQNAVVQPLQDGQGNILLWNGEIFDGIQVLYKTGYTINNLWGKISWFTQVPGGANDTLVLLQQLQNCDDDCQILSTLSYIQGPWAVVYWQEKSQKLWFGRDFFGRRSLIWKLPINQKDHFIVTSVATRSIASESYKWKEILTGIYCVQLSKCSESFTIHKYPWMQNLEHHVPYACETQTIGNDNYCQIVTSTTQFVPSPVKHSLNLSEPAQDDLTNLYVLLGTENLQDANNSVKIEKLGKELFSQFSDISAFRNEIHKFTGVLAEAVCKRVQNLPEGCKCQATGAKAQSCGHAKVGILFSGGLDSTVLCVLADRFVPQEDPIDLFNVAFQQCQPKANESTNFQVPDRMSGFQAMQELSIINPRRKWNFVEINVTKDEVEKQCEEHIWDLVYPLDTVLDGDIGSAIWFASRGEGIVSQFGRFKSYAKVILTGMGADEQLGGYSRHRVRFEKDGWIGLLQEMNMDMGRISVRNLGRDDRVISDHGREARFPFLDENVVDYLNVLPIWMKVNLALPRGIGDKLLLRLLAYNLGLPKTACLAKRAIQFGSRISKLEAGRKGSDRIDKLATKLLPDHD